jgi:hypothetical protein
MSIPARLCLVGNKSIHRAGREERKQNNYATEQCPKFQEIKR